MREPGLKTLFVGRQFHFLPVCASTNALALAAVGNNDATPEGLTIVADHQTAGRGQRGNQWQAVAGQNLLLSVVLRPKWLAVAEQFRLSIVVALAGRDTLRAVLPPVAAAQVRIKWPNDLYIGSHKTGGILIENSVRGTQFNASIVGIGLNVNQTFFDPALPNPTSLAHTAGHLFERETVLATLLEHLEARYLALRAGQAAPQLAQYLNSLYLRGEEALFAFEGCQQRGIIEGIDPRGQLLVRFPEAGVRAFGMQEVQLVGK